MEEKKTMSQLLRDLPVSEAKVFPIHKRTSVVNTIQRLKFEGYKFSTETFAGLGRYVVVKMVNPKKEKS